MNIFKNSYNQGSVVPGTSYSYDRYDKSMDSVVKSIEAARLSGKDFYNFRVSKKFRGLQLRSRLILKDHCVNDLRSLGYAVGSNVFVYQNDYNVIVTF